MFRNMMLVILAVLSCVQLAIGVASPDSTAHSFEYTWCREAVYNVNQKIHPMKAYINGVANITYIQAPLGDYIRFDSVIMNDKIVAMGSSDLVDSLHGIPTSDDKARVDRDAFYGVGGETGSSVYSVLPVWEDPTTIQTFISYFLISRDDVTPEKDILDWASGDEWGIDYAGQCDDYQGYYLEVECKPIVTDYCQLHESTVTQKKYGSIGSGNSLMRQLEQDLACSNHVTFASEADIEDEVIAITVFTYFDDGDVLRIYDGSSNSATLLAEYTSAENFVHQAIYTSQPDEFYIEFETSNTTGNGFTIVYERTVDDLGNGTRCFAPSVGCDSPCLTDLGSSYELAFGYFIDPNFNFADCVNERWSEECVLAAYTLENTGICGSETEQRFAGTQGFMLNKPNQARIQSTDRSKRDVHFANLAAMSL